VLEDQRDRLVLRPVDADHHGAIRGKSVAFESSHTGYRGRHFQDVVIPPGLTLDVFAAVNRRAVLTVGDVAVEEGLVGAPSYMKLRETVMFPSRSLIVTVPV
jgi:hypothetical protein